MLLNGSQIVMEVLLEHGVDTVFGYPGGSILNIYDQIYQYSDRIRHVTTAHEQGAAHAADGYARATGKVGVVMSTSGPGATNLVTGLATAQMDSIPLVAICANVPDKLIGRDTFQEVSITTVTMAITKHNYFVNDIEDLADVLREAFMIAESGRKGPVLIDITKDVTAAVTEFKPMAPLALRKTPAPDMDVVYEIADMLNSCHRPVIYAGGGIVSSGAEEQVLELVRKADIPLVHTLMACGVIGRDPHDLGMIGMHGSVSANMAVDEADLVLSLGARFSDRVALNPDKFAASARIIQVDLDKSEINKNVDIFQSCACDIKDFLTALLPLTEEKKHSHWDEELSRLKASERIVETDAALTPSAIFHILNEKTPQAVYTTDVGQHQMWAAQYLEHKKPRNFLTSGGLGTMGYGYGAAIGAQFGRPGERVVHITGDGSFHMNMNEACTAVTQNLPIITVILNNQVLGLVYQWQTLFYGGRYSNTILERKTDYVKVIEGFGGTGFRAGNPEEFAAAYEQALKCEGPVWIDCAISREERVLPMIPGGKSVDSMIVE
ncbi:MAG: biosynthetic-type acetolactate synthase large subunit [Firmicutes bacterium]|nr:biosynthetic-type acetolactate synthase large subunit [Bacillota bacterium]